MKDAYKDAPFFAVYSSAGWLVTNLKVFHSQDFEKKIKAML